MGVVDYSVTSTESSTRGPTRTACWPKKPIQNCFVESFNGKFRDECLSEHWFADIPHARRIIESWRVDYNEVRPHSALENLSPRAFAERAA